MLPQISIFGARWHNASLEMTRSWIAVVVLAPMLGTHLMGQELDTSLRRQERSSERSTIIDQVQDPKERRAFLKLYEAREPHRRRSLASAFLGQYPQSWLLSEVLEILSKTSIDLGEYDDAIRFGSQSLRLLPENPLLLAPLADVQIRQGRLAQARENARASLEYLDEFDRPAAVAPHKWPSVRDQLKAWADYVLGRVEVAEALSRNAAERHEGLIRAETFLQQAQSLNPIDNEVTYTLGLTEMSLGKQQSAAFYFSKISNAAGPLQNKALDNLRRIYAAQATKSMSFDAFVASAGREREVQAAPGTEHQTRSEKQVNEYAGSQACRSCHAAIYESWQQSGMGRMFRSYRPANVIADFRSNNQFSDTSGAIVARMTTKGDKCYFTIREASGNWNSYSVDYTIGSKWQQAFATRTPAGDIQVFPIQYNALNRKWVNYWKVIDPPGSPRTDVSAFSEFSSATSYRANCAPCHTSHLRISPPGSSLPQDIEFSEGGINCEMCHGPGEDHVRAMKMGRASAGAGTGTVVDFNQIQASRYVAICGQCHAQSALREPGPNGEMNYPADGATFPPRYLRRPFAELSRLAFYKDGRFRETTFIVEAFRRSACFQKGQAHCGRCHQPHGPDAASNTTSLKFPNDPDRMCLQCHSKFLANPASHTHHAAASEGSRCVSCHMPRIMNSVLFKARTHQIDDIPDAGMTERFGTAESPNACLLCHSDKDARWVGVKLLAWSGS